MILYKTAVILIINKCTNCNMSKLVNFQNYLVKLYILII